MNELSFQERRQYPRHEADLQVIFSSMHFSQLPVVRIQDIALHGLGVMLNTAIKTGLWMDVEVVPNGSADRVKTRGRVVWVNKIADDHYRAGIALATGDSQFNPC